MGQQGKVDNGTGDVHRIDLAVDIARVSAHLNGLVEVVGVGADPLNSHLVLAQQPMLAGLGIGHVMAVGHALAKSVQGVAAGETHQGEKG